MAADDTFRDGVAVITGAGAGIGAGLARAAAQQGMIVVVSDVSKERAESVAQSIAQAGGRAHPFVTDVRDKNAVADLAVKVYDQFGGVRLLINNAGIGTYGFTWDLDPAKWDNAMNINVNGIFYGIHAFVPRMIKADKRAAVVNLSSLGALTALPLAAPYIVSKHAVLALTECLYLEMQLVKAPIDVSVVVPSRILTPFYSDVVVGDGSALTAKYRDMMHESAKLEGMDPDEAGRVMFPQIMAGDFWISTDFQMTKDIAAVRGEFIRSQARPELPGPVRDAIATLAKDI